MDASLKTYSAIVESIYAAAFEPELWSVTAAHVKEATNSVLAAFVIEDMLTPGQPPAYWGAGIPDGYLDLYRRTAHINPRFVDSALSKPGDLLVQSRLQPEEELMQTPFYHEFVKPMGLRDAMVSISLRSGARAAAFVSNSSANREPYTDDEIALMRLLTPHFCRAMTISDILELRMLQVGVIEAALNALAAGVFLLDQQGRVLHMNRAAEQIIALGTVLSVRSQRLMATDRASQDALAHAIAETHRPVLEGPPSIALKAVNSSEKGMIATLLPIDYARADIAQLHSAARWAVFVQDPRQPVPFPGEAFGRLYSLSPAELRVTMALAPGLSHEEAAAMLGVSVATVRSHLQRIFIKTGTSRHLDLMKLLFAAMPPVAPGC